MGQEMRTDWDSRYETGDIPWDSGSPSGELRRVLADHHITPCRALEPGCGTGTNCVFLAHEGFEVTGFDLSARAIDAARARIHGQQLSCRFLVADVFQLPELGPGFNFIFDRGCYHTVRSIDERAVVETYARLLTSGGRLMVLTGNANDPDKHDNGPPKVTESELRRAFQDHFEVVRLDAFRFDTKPGRDFRPLGWSMLLRKT